MLHFGVELHAVELSFAVLKGRDRAVFGVCGGLKALGQTAYVIGMAHQRRLFLFEVAEERAGVFQINLYLPVFAHLAGRNLAAERVCHKLHAVADAENGNAEAEYALVAPGGRGIVNAVRPAREDDADGVEFLDLFNGRSAGENEGMNVHFPDAPRDKFLVLSAEVEHYDGFACIHKSYSV